MRLSKERLIEITSYQLPSCQVRWFKEHLGVTVECDRKGPIMTDTVYDALLLKRYGITQPTTDNTKPRPAVRLKTGS